MHSGYLAPVFDKDGVITNFDYFGTSGASFNTEIDFTAYLPNSIKIITSILHVCRCWYYNI